MAKVQAKKAGAAVKKNGGKRSAGAKQAPSRKAAKSAKPAANSRKAKPAPKKAAPKAKAARPVKAAKPAKTSKPAKTVSKPAKAAKPAKPAKAARTAKAAPAKGVAKAAQKPLAAKAQPVASKHEKPLQAAKKSVKAAAAKVVKAVVGAAAAAASSPVAARVAHAVAAKISTATDKKRTRRPRTRLTSNGPAVANWFSQEKARPSSFIPAPPRAEAPSLVAAPPASSDRLIRPEDLNHLAVRTVPVRVDIELGGGRLFISVNPMEVSLRPGEGIEWDFRYLGGADVTVEEVVIDFERPSPFASVSFRSHKPGSARPHRQLSGGASAGAARRVDYTIRAISTFKTEMARVRPVVSII